MVINTLHPSRAGSKNIRKTPLNQSQDHINQQELMSIIYKIESEE